MGGGAATAAWHTACAADEELRHLAAPASVSFRIRGDGPGVCFRFPVLAPAGEGAADEVTFEVVAPDSAWERFFRPVPPPPFHAVFGMLMRVPGVEVRGDELAFVQHVHLVRRVLEIGRETASGPAEPAPPVSPPTGVDRIQGHYIHLPQATGPCRVLVERSGRGRDVLFLHTAGADGRQYHHLMNDERLLERCLMTAFDLPGHGRSDLPASVVPGSYRLTTDAYVDAVLGVVEALGLEQPVVVGSSMGGEICLELAYRHPDRLGGVVACEASDHVPGRRVRWARHPAVDQTMFVPEWVDGLMAPQSPRRHRREVWWGYSQGGYGTFYGDVLFYSGDWDGRDRVTAIDTARCPVIMLTGEYDYSCTPEMSRRTAERIPGAVFRTMPGLGHFPMAENPLAFAVHLLAALDEIDSR